MTHSKMQKKIAEVLCVCGKASPAEQRRQIICGLANLFQREFPHFDTELLVASLRHPRHVMQAALCGADAATMPLGIIRKLLDHPLTDSGLEKFLSDYRKL